VMAKIAHRLSEREKLVALSRLAEGNFSISEIAKELSCSPTSIYKLKNQYADALSAIKKKIALGAYTKASNIISDIDPKSLTDEKPLTRAQIADILLKNATKLDGSETDEKNANTNIAIFFGKDAEVRAAQIPGKGVAIVCPVRPAAFGDAGRQDNPGGVVDAVSDISEPDEKSLDTRSDIQDTQPVNSAKVP